MKIALTSDLHLTNREDHPERFGALEDIFRQMIEEKIGLLIIAGDLFQGEQAGISDFDALCSTVREDGISVLVLPGNHDHNLHDRRFTAANVRVVHETTILELAKDSPPFLFVPYQLMSMGEAIAPFADELTRGEWILISHGDYIQSLREPNLIEPGIYMPLTMRDLQEFKPLRTFLGHIHKPYDGDRLHYMGSPCSLDPTETGRRRFLVFETKFDTVESRIIHKGVIHFAADIICLPGEDEVGRLKAEMDRTVASWNLSPEEIDRVRIRVRLRGFASDLRKLSREVKRALKGFTLDQEPDLSGLALSDDPDRRRIVERVQEQMDGLRWNDGPDEPSPADILEAALKAIYGD